MCQPDIIHWNSQYFECDECISHLYEVFIFNIQSTFYVSDLTLIISLTVKNTNLKRNKEDISNDIKKT